MLPRHTIALATLTLSSCLFGCVTPTQFDTEMNALRRELADTQAELDRTTRVNEELEVRVAELVRMSELVDATAGVQRDLVLRLDAVERTRLAEMAATLSAQEARVEDLSSDLEGLRECPPMQALTKLQKGLSDLGGQVQVNQRLTNSNRDNLAEVSHALDLHEIEFNRQMKLLGQYIREQFVPLADGFVAHLYQESRRLSVASQELEDFARRVDPYKFTHLQPGFPEEQEAPNPDTPRPPKSEDD